MITTKTMDENLSWNFSENQLHEAENFFLISTLSYFFLSVLFLILEKKNDVFDGIYYQM